MRKDFCLCFNDGFTPYAAVTIKSVVENMNDTDEIHLHILSDYISESHQRHLLSIVNRCSGGGYLHVYDVELSKLKNLPTKNWTIYSWLRILSPELLDENIHKILYLDCDVIVNDSLDELFEMEMNDKYIAACLDPDMSYSNDTFVRLKYDKKYHYICSGVLMINMVLWRSENIANKLIAFSTAYPEMEYPDQDAINYVCCHKKVVLPPQYGVVCTYFTNVDFINHYKAEMPLLIASPAIVHYAGYAPWVYCKNKALHRNLWWNTYRSLHAFPQVRIGYVMSIIKWYGRCVLSGLHIIDKTSKYYTTTQYYNHKPLTAKRVAQFVDQVMKMT